jgi:hypothetical protein
MALPCKIWPIVLPSIPRKRLHHQSPGSNTSVADLPTGPKDARSTVLTLDEEAMIVAFRQHTLLRSSAELANILQPLNLSAGQLRDVLQNAQQLADKWSAKSAADQRALLQSVLIKVCLKHDHVELTVSRRGLLQTITDTTEPSTARSGATPSHQNADLEHGTEDDAIIIQTTTGLEPSGNGLRLIISDTTQSQPNLHLAPLLGEAFMLREALLNGTHDSIEAMSNALQRGKGYINARIRLTYLSPQLIKKILNGEVPASLSATRLLEATKDLPVKWAEQTRFFEALAR